MTAPAAASPAAAAASAAVSSKTATVAQTAVGVANGYVQCWCCGAQRPPDDVVHLGDHPEVALCLRCAHFVHRQARSLEDATRAPRRAARVRDVLRAGRGQVLRHGWQARPAIGPVLRWLGNRLP